MLLLKVAARRRTAESSRSDGWFVAASNERAEEAASGVVPRSPKGKAGSALAAAVSLSFIAMASQHSVRDGPAREMGTAGATRKQGGPVRVHRGLGGLDELRPTWEAVSHPWASPMLSPAWLRAWAEVYGTGPDLEFLVAGDGHATAIAPLVHSRRGGPRLELAGPDNLVEVMDFLYEDGSHIPALAGALARSRAPLRFWRIPADSPVVPALTEAYRGRGLVRCQASAPCPSLPLDATWANPLDRLDAHRRSNARRARRIAEGLGPVSTEILSPRPEEVGPLLDEAYAVEAAGWKSREGSPLARDPLVGDFFRRYARLAAETGELRICFLRIGGRAAAMKLASVTGDRFWLLAMGFSEEFERCSPGTLLLLDTLQYAARSRLRSYEFLGADEPWVRAWMPTQRPCVSIRTYPIGVRGAVALVSDGSDRVRFRARTARAGAERVFDKVVQRLALAYSAGPSPGDASRTAESLSTIGYSGILGYMNAENEDPRIVARNSMGALDTIHAGGLDCYLSIKAPPLRFDRGLVRGIVTSGREKGIRIHFDGMAADDVDRTFALTQEMQAFHPNLGCTLSGRWQRSMADAQRAIDLGLSVRVIKGEWADRPERECDPVAGFLEIVDRLAGHVPQVGVATHNPTLARKSVRRLRAAGTPCEIEVVRGYPIHRVLPVAIEEGVPVRVYVPFGHIAFPYTVSKVVHEPRIALWALRDVFRGGTSVVPKDPRRKGGGRAEDPRSAAP